MTEADYKRLLDHATWLISKLQHENNFLRRQNEKLHDELNEQKKRTVRIPLKRVPQ